MADVYVLAEKQKKALLAMERQIATELVNNYGAGYALIEKKSARLFAEIERRIAAGEEVKMWKVYKMQRYAELEAQILKHSREYAVVVERALDRTTANAVAMAALHVGENVDAALPGPINRALLGQAGIPWNELPASALKEFTALTTAGSPLDTLLMELGQTTAEGVKRSIAASISAGTSPREAARAIRSTYGMGLTRSLRIARTETLRSYRETSRASYKENPHIVKGWIWTSSKDDVCCAACLGMDGQEFENDQFMEAHVNCRCSLIPKTISYNDLGIDVDDKRPERETGGQWFDKQSADKQREMLGDARYEKFKGGASLDDMTKRVDNTTWGASRQVRPLKEM